MTPVRWSPLAVKEAMDLVEEHVNNAITPMELAKEETKKAMLLPRLPQYMEQELRGLHGDLDYGIHRAQNAIARIRGDLPAEKMAKEENQRKTGLTQALV